MYLMRMFDPTTNEALTMTKIVETNRRMTEFRVDHLPNYNRKSALRWIISHLLRYKILFPVFMLAAITSMAFRSLIPMLIGLVFDLLITDSSLTHATFLVILLGFTSILQTLLSLISRGTLEVLAQRLERDTREELYVALLGKSQTFHDRQEMGDIMARATNDVRQLNLMMNPGISLIFESILIMIIPLFFIFSINPELLLVPVSYIILFIIFIRRYNQQLSPVVMKMRMQFSRMNTSLTETIKGMATVKAYVKEAEEKFKFLDQAKKYRDYFVEQGKIQGRYIPLLLISLAITAGFLHSYLLFTREKLSVSQIIQFLGLMTLLRVPTFLSIFTFSLVQLGLASASRVLQLIQAETEIDENLNGYQARIKGEVEFKNVSFSYNSERLVLRNISFKAEPGQAIAIVGQTGSGKSTLVKLIYRLYDVDEGQILIDGVDVRDWNLKSLRSQMGVIEQGIFLFNRSIRENIAFGKDATMEEIIEAAKQAQAHEFIMDFKDGYDTTVGESGVMLSGGQRQRIAIARAFLSNPKILILDDSTSAIDSRTEDEIQKAMRRILKGRTTFLITHRLSQIRWADQILVLVKGRIVARGTHEELLRTSPHYRKIYNQFDVELPPLESNQDDSSEIFEKIAVDDTSTTHFREE